MQVHCGKSKEKNAETSKIMQILMPGFNPNTEDGWIGFSLLCPCPSRLAVDVIRAVEGVVLGWPEGRSGHSWSGHDPCCGQQSHSGKVEITLVGDGRGHRYS